MAPERSMDDHGQHPLFGKQGTGSTRRLRQLVCRLALQVRDLRWQFDHRLDRVGDRPHLGRQGPELRKPAASREHQHLVLGPERQMGAERPVAVRPRPVELAIQDAARQFERHQLGDPGVRGLFRRHQYDDLFPAGRSHRQRVAELQPGPGGRHQPDPGGPVISGRPRILDQPVGQDQRSQVQLRLPCRRRQQADRWCGLSQEHQRPGKHQRNRQPRQLGLDQPRRHGQIRGRPDQAVLPGLRIQDGQPEPRDEHRLCLQRRRHVQRAGAVLCRRKLHAGQWLDLQSKRHRLADRLRQRQQQQGAGTGHLGLRPVLDELELPVAPRQDPGRRALRTDGRHGHRAAAHPDGDGLAGKEQLPGCLRLDDAAGLYPEVALHQPAAQPRHGDEHHGQPHRSSVVQQDHGPSAV